MSRKLKNSEGASLASQHSQFAFANSLGFMAGFPTSRHSLWCSVIAEDKGLMQRDDWYSAARVPAKVADAAALGRYAGEPVLLRQGRVIAATFHPELTRSRGLHRYLLAAASPRRV